MVMAREKFSKVRRKRSLVRVRSHTHLSFENLFEQYTSMKELRDSIKDLTNKCSDAWLPFPSTSIGTYISRIGL